MTNRFKIPRYTGEPRLEESAFVNLGKGKVIFVEHMSDLWADQIPDGWILRVLAHCRAYPNTYVFQTKNPDRYLDFVRCGDMPRDYILGTTIESNRVHPQMGGPKPLERALAMVMLREAPFYIQTFITVEPILKFDVEAFAFMLIQANPTFVNIGADSKGSGLEEPTWDEITALIARLAAAGIEIRQKSNLERLK